MYFNKTILSVIAILFFSLGCFAQSNEGINYKAIIKDSNGNVVANQSVDVEVQIMKDQGMELIYHESHSITTNANGLVVLIIGEGTSLGADVEELSEIEWDSGIYFYKVLVDIGNGLIDMGTDLFKSVPYASYATKAGNVFSGNYNDLINQPTITVPTGLEALDEGNGIGWRLKGRDPLNYGSIGFYAVDLSNSFDPSGVFGATGEGAIAMGGLTEASGDYATAIGVLTEASGDYATAMGIDTEALGNYTTAMGAETRAVGAASTAMGFQTEASVDYTIATGLQSLASGIASTAMGAQTIASGVASTALGFNTQATGDYSVALGEYTIASGTNSLAIGSYNTTSSNQVLTVGIGTSNSNRKNALTINDAGMHIIRSDITGLAIYSGSSFLDDGIRIESPGGFGMRIGSTGTDGVRIITAGAHGVNVSQANSNGVIVYSAGENGGLFKGTISGVHAESINDSNPDVILGGTINTATGDNGIIASDPTYLSSDIFLRSNDAVVIELDSDNNESGQFEIKAGDGSEVFEVDESGTVRVNNVVQHSDRRLKKDITNLPYGLKEILALNPKMYNWKHRKQNHKSLGLIAQEVQPIINEIVNAQEDEAKTLGINYTELIPVLVKAIQEQQVKIEKLENKLRMITQQLEALENKN